MIRIAHRTIKEMEESDLASQNDFIVQLRIKHEMGAWANNTNSTQTREKKKKGNQSNS